MLARIGTAVGILCGIVLATMLVLVGLPKLLASLRMLWLTIRVFRRKAHSDRVVSAPVGPWKKPRSRRELLEELGTDKIIWGYWHQGSDHLPGFCDMAVQSWRLRHPDWKIIVLSEDNYQEYVSHTDLPSTFDSLKIQIRSDIIRSAVLQRDGGVYMDISYVVLKALDDIWDKAKQNNDIYLTSLWTLPSPQGHDMVVPNICLIVAPRPHNPVLATWHRSLLDYFECPSVTTQDMKQHPVLSRVSFLLDHPALWVCKRFSPYLASLWTLCDTLYFDTSVRNYVRDHVFILPTLLWTVDQMMAPMFRMKENDIYDYQIRHESMWVWMQRTPPCVQLNFDNDAAAAEKFVSLGNAVKASTDFCRNFHAPQDYHLSLQTTQGRIWRAALDKTRPTEQATTRGAFPIVPLPEYNNDDSDEKKSLSIPMKEVVIERRDTDPTVSMGDVELSSQTSLSFGDSSFSDNTYIAVSV